METSQQAISAFQSFVSVAQRIKGVCRQRNAPRHVQVPSPIPIPALNLPLPDRISGLMASSGMPDFLIKQLSVKVMNDIERLKDVHRARFEQACRDLLSTPRSSADTPLSVLFFQLQQSYQNSFLNRTQLLIKDVTRHARYAWGTHLEMHTVDKRKQPFNRECVPLLEMYFEYNAYPSPRDRMALARTCMVTQRQIEVWFQNHRNRAKKEGKALRRLQAHSIPANISFDSLRNQLPLLTAPLEVPLAECVSSPNDDVTDECISDNDVEVSPRISEIYDNNPLDTSAPAHAFPTRFKAECGYEPFPRDKDGNCVFRSLPFSWMRKPATKITSAVPVNFEEFVEMFATKLHMRVPSKKRRENKTTLLSSTPASWYMTRVTKPFPAPHPALVRLPYRNSSTPSQPQVLSQITNYRKALVSLPNRAPSGRPLNTPVYIPSNNSWNHSPRSSSSSTDRSLSSSSFSSGSAPSTPSSSPAMQPCQLQCVDDISFTNIASQPLFTHDDFIFSSLQTGLQFFTSQLVHI
ncbi:hypothetical protein BDQ17DRAFT_1341384 [Cyathus striatus]|nr:hypothetical protein BDQ17DRAFT_1341384 [Cyathus striatus]